MDKNKAVCLLNDSFPPTIDGVGNTVVNYARSMTKNGQRAIVATPKYPNVNDSSFEFPVIRYPSINTTRIFGYRMGYPFNSKAIKRIKEQNVELVHTHCPVISTMLARSLREETGVPVIMTYHTKFDIEINKAIEWNFMRKTALKMLVANIEACDEVWVVSRGAGENLKKLGYKGDVVLMENGVDLSKGRAADEKIEEIREKHSIPNGSTR